MSYLDETLQALASGNMYVSPEAAAAAPINISAIKQQIGDLDVAVVILPSSAKQEITSLPEFVRDVASSTSFDTVFVAVGSDMEAGSRVLPQGKASQLANQAESEYANVGEAAQHFVTEVGAQPPAPSGPEEVPVFGIASAVIGTLVVTGSALLFLRRRAQRIERFNLRHINTTNADIRRLGREIKDASIARSIQDCSNSLKLLLDEIESSKDDIRRVRAEFEVSMVQYRDILRDYLKIQDDPNHKVYPESKHDEVRRTVVSTTKTLSDAATTMYNDIKNDSIDKSFYANAESLKLRFPQNILNEK